VENSRGPATLPAAKKTAAIAIVLNFVVMMGHPFFLFPDGFLFFVVFIISALYAGGVGEL